MVVVVAVMVYHNAKYIDRIRIMNNPILTWSIPSRRCRCLVRCSYRYADMHRSIWVSCSRTLPIPERIDTCSEQRKCLEEGRNKEEEYRRIKKNEEEEEEEEVKVKIKYIDK